MHSKPTENQLTTNSEPTHSTHTQDDDQVDPMDERDPQHLIRGGRIKDGPIRMTPEELRETRKRLCISFRSFSRLLGLSDHMMLYHWEAGNKRVPCIFLCSSAWSEFSREPVLASGWASKSNSLNFLQQSSAGTPST